MYEYSAKVLRVIDGDTLEVSIDVGFNVHVHECVRLMGINTPEITGSKAKDPAVKSAGLASKAFVESWVAATEGNVVLASYDVKSVLGTLNSPDVKKLKQEKYGRWLAILTSKADNSVLNNLLVKQGLASEM